MSAMQPDYTVTKQIHENVYIEGLGRSVPGWTITVRDSITGTFVPVFVDDGHYTPENVRTYIEAALVPVRAVATLGQSSQPAA